MKKDEKNEKEVKEVQKNELKEKETKQEVVKENTEKKEETAKQSTEKKEEVNKSKNNGTKAKSKKTDKKENAKKLNNKSMTFVTIIIAIIAIIVVGYFLMLNITKNSAIKEVETAFNAMKAGDEETIKKYLNEGEGQENTETNTDETSKEMAKIMLSNMDYKIVSAKASNNQCIIKLNISNKNLEEVFKNYMQKVFSLAFSQEFVDTQEDEVNTKMKDIFQEQYNSDSIETISNEITITMKKENGKWDMYGENEEIINAILPGYKSITNSLS